MKISIQQPEYFPWLGYFDKLLQVDKVIFLDNVQFKKRYFENRNKIRTYNGWSWINTPVITKGRYTQKIMEVEIDNSQDWQDKIVKSIFLNYKKTPYWSFLGEELYNLILKPYNLLVDFNLEIIFFLMNKIGIKREYFLASKLETKMSGSDLILEICKKVDCKQYLSGKDGKNYLDINSFSDNNIKLVFQNFNHPVYKQFHGEFIQSMSVIDLLFNYGPDSIKILKENLGG